jgi:putative transposase
LERQLFGKETLPMIRTDNGPQFVSHVFEETCLKLQVEHERIPPKTPNKNAHIEAFHAILEKDCLSRYEFGNYQDAYQVVSDYNLFYNQRRTHGSLYDLSPAQFVQAIQQQNVAPLVIKVCERTKPFTWRDGYDRLASLAMPI